MPWKETRVMDEKIRFRSLVNASEESLVELCRLFGISRKTGYKWIQRYGMLGPRGFEHRIRVPSDSPNATPLEGVRRVLELRKEPPSWGPKKRKARVESLGMENVPAASTIGHALKKHGLIHPRRRRVYPLRRPSECEVASLPNDTWCIDFKGQLHLGDQTLCSPLTLTDSVSHSLLKCEG